MLEHYLKELRWITMTGMVTLFVVVILQPALASAPAMECSQMVGAIYQLIGFYNGLDDSVKADPAAQNMLNALHNYTVYLQETEDEYCHTLMEKQVD